MVCTTVVCYRWIFDFYIFLLERSGCVILLLGYGIGNQAIEKYLQSKYKEYYIYDDYIENYQKIDDEILSLVELVVKSSGIDNEHYLIKYLENKDIKIVTDLEFYYLYRKYQNFTAVITGSNGKSTTVKLIKHFIDDAICCGNIGDQIGNYLETNKPLIIEVSSYMAEYCFNCKANVVGYINVYPNHLRHHHDFDSYLNEPPYNFCWSTNNNGAKSPVFPYVISVLEPKSINANEEKTLKSYLEALIKNWKWKGI